MSTVDNIAVAVTVGLIVFSLLFATAGLVYALFRVLLFIWADVGSYVIRFLMECVYFRKATEITAVIDVTEFSDHDYDSTMLPNVYNDWLKANCGAWGVIPRIQIVGRIAHYPLWFIRKSDAIAFTLRWQ